MAGMTDITWWISHKLEGSRIFILVSRLKSSVIIWTPEHCVYVCVLLGIETRVFLTTAITDLCLKPPLISSKAIMYACTLRKIMWQHSSQQLGKADSSQYHDNPWLDRISSLWGQRPNEELIPNPSCFKNLMGLTGKKAMGWLLALLQSILSVRQLVHKTIPARGTSSPRLQKS